MPSGNLGRMGEALLEKLCAEVNLTANKAVNDDHGWDYIVEFPRELNMSSGLAQIDRQGCQCKIQVKATRGTKKSWQVELSNLHGMCTDTLPAFYLFIHYDGGVTPADAYLLHVDQGLISRTLKRVFENESSSNKKKLNRIKISLKYDNSHRLESIDGQSLIKKIVRHIGSDQASYVSKKAAYLLSAGYEQTVAEIKFDLKSKGIAEFVDAAIGLRDGVEVKSLRAEGFRFGIGYDIPNLRHDKALMKIENPDPKAGILHLRKGKLSPAISFSARLYSPPPIFPVDSDFIKFRFDCGFFDLVIGGEEKTFSFNIDLGRVDRFSVQKVGSFLSLLNATSKKEDKIYFSFESDEIFSRFDFIASAKSEFTGVIESMCSDFSSLTSILSKFELGQDVFLSCEEFDLLRPRAREFSSLLDCGNYFLKVNFNVDRPLDGSKSSAVVFLGSIVVGKFFLLALFVAKGNARSMGDLSYEIVTNEVMLAEKLFVFKGDTSHYDDIRLLVEGLMSSFADGYNVISLVDLAWFSKNNGS